MLKTAKQWCEITGIEVIDPDGWDRKSKTFHEDWNNHRISFNEFYDRCCNSTTRGMRDHDVMWGEIFTKLCHGQL